MPLEMRRNNNKEDAFESVDQIKIKLRPILALKEYGLKKILDFNFSTH